jgi:pimeloyl-ACP methyl ester carboxylesterase
LTDFEGVVDVAGGRLWAQAAGEGTGVVLAHAGVADARMWDPQWDAIAARHRVVRYDLRGFGRADVEHTTFSNQSDLLAVVDAAGLVHGDAAGLPRRGGLTASGRRPRDCCPAAAEGRRRPATVHCE